MNNDVSLHNLVVLVVTIPTSPRLSKTEFVCGRYCVFTDRHFSDKILEREKEKGLPYWPPCRPGPAPRLDHLSGAPASLPAWAGSQAGPCGCFPGLPAGLGRLPDRPMRHSGLPAGLGRLPGRPMRVVSRLPCPPWPARWPASLCFLSNGQNFTLPI